MNLSQRLRRLLHEGLLVHDGAEKAIRTLVKNGDETPLQRVANYAHRFVKKRFQSSLNPEIPKPTAEEDSLHMYEIFSFSSGNIPWSVKRKGNEVVFFYRDGPIYVEGIYRPDHKMLSLEFTVRDEVLQSFSDDRHDDYRILIRSISLSWELIQYIYKNYPLSAIVFSALEDEPGRVTLYQRIARKWTKLLGGQLDIHRVGHEEDTYVIYNYVYEITLPYRRKKYNAKI